jgi:hypothetical protein
MPPFVQIGYMAIFAKDTGYVSIRGLSIPTGAVSTEKLASIVVGRTNVKTYKYGP